MAELAYSNHLCFVYLGHLGCDVFKIAMSTMPFPWRTSKKVHGVGTVEEGKEGRENEVP